MASLNKWLYNFARRKVVPWLKLSGESDTVGATVITVLLKNPADKVLLCQGTSVPTGAGYAKGCLFIKTDAATGTKGIYENQGTTTSASFNVIGDVTGSEIALASGYILVGNSSNVAASVAASGDVVISSNGVTSLANSAASRLTSAALGLSVANSVATSETSKCNSAVVSEDIRVSTTTSVTTSRTSQIDSVVVSANLRLSTVTSTANSG